MDVNFWTISLHVVTSLISAGVVAIATIVAIRATVRNNVRRIERLESWDAWYRLVITQLATLHNVNHPDKPVMLPDMPEVPYSHHS